MVDFGSDEERMEKEYGGRQKTIFEEARELYPVAHRKYHKTLREVYDRLVELRGMDDNSWKE